MLRCISEEQGYCGQVHIVTINDWLALLGHGVLLYSKGETIVCSISNSEIINGKLKSKELI